MRTLKIAVIVMGVMLVVGFAALVAVIAHRLSQPPAAAALATAAAPRPEAAFTATPVDLPAGARVETIGVGPNRLALSLVLADGTRQVILLDLADGRRVGTIPLRPLP